MHLVVLRVRHCRFAVPLDRVVEVDRMVAVTPVPDLPAPLLGLVNIRGTTAPVADLAARLGLEPRPYTASDHLVVTKVRGLGLALVVDEVEEIWEWDGQQHAVEDDADDVLDCVALRDTELVPVLRTDNILSDGGFATARRLVTADRPAARSSRPTTAPSAVERAGVAG